MAHRITGMPSLSLLWYSFGVKTFLVKRIGELCLHDNHRGSLTTTWQICSKKKKRSKKHNSCFTSIWIQTKKMICIDCLTTSLCKALHKNFVRQFLNLSATVFFNSCMVNVVRFCQEFVHNTALLLATWIFSAGTCILYNIFPWKTFIRKWTELSTFCFCFLLCNYFTETWERVAQDEE